MVKILILVTLVLFFAWWTSAWPDPQRAGRDTLCNRVWPTKDGRWKNDPPFWEFAGCPIQMFSRENVTDCMKGRTFYVMGNSVARQNAFNLVELLGGMSVPRENQKAMCPKTELTWDESCHQEYAGVKIKHLFFQYMDGYYYDSRSGFPFYRYREYDERQGHYVLRTGRLVNATQSYGVTPDLARDDNKNFVDDNCGQQQTRVCLQEFFKGSKEEDVLIFTLGHAYLLPTMGEQEKEERELLEKGGVKVDIKAWLMNSAAAFKGHVSASFKGTVFCVLMPPTHPYRFLSSWSPSLYLTNEALYSLWQSSNEAKPWYFIDQWRINVGRERLYNDQIHFNGPLSHATLYQVFNELCPQRGTKQSTVWPNVGYKGKILYDKDEFKYYLVNEEGYRVIVHLPPADDPRNTPIDSPSQMPSQSPNLRASLKTQFPLQVLSFTQSLPTLPSYYLSLPLLPLSHATIVTIALSSSFCPYLPEHKLIMGDGRSVYLLEAGSKRVFPNADVFLSNGYDFGDVARIDDYCVKMIPDGPDMKKKDEQ